MDLPSLIAAATSTGTAVTVTDSQATISGPRSETIDAPVDDVTATIDELIAQLGALRSQITTAATADRDQRRADAHQAEIAAWEALDPTDLGLVDRDGTWVHPDHPHVNVTTDIEVPVNTWNGPLLHLRVATGDHAVAIVTEQADGTRTVTRRGLDNHPDTDVWGTTARLNKTQRGELDSAAAWAGRRDASSIEELCAAAADTTVAEMVTAVDALCDTNASAADAATQARDTLRTEWLALSRSKERIPTKALEDWVRKHSSYDHDATGYIIGGFGITIDIIAGGHRPDALTRTTFGKVRGKDLPGAAKVYQAVRLTYISGRNRRFAPSMRFYDTDLDSLRDTLGDTCDVVVTHDRQAVFVCYRRDDLVELCDAAAVEWTLTRTAD